MDVARCLLAGASQASDVPFTSLKVSMLAIFGIKNLEKRESGVSWSEIRKLYMVVYSPCKPVDISHSTQHKVLCSCQ